MERVISGNEAVAYGAMLSRVQVIPSYPISPQTTIVEALSDFCASGKLKADFVKVESEHSAMSCCVGAASAGARTFTATSAQGGLLVMGGVPGVSAGSRVSLKDHAGILRVAQEGACLAVLLSGCGRPRRPSCASGAARRRARCPGRCRGRAGSQSG